MGSQPDVQPQADLDGDGLADAFEQALLEKFAPAFRVSVPDCDVAPSEFQSSSREPVAIAKNGTIYGQVFPVARGSRPGAFIEIHYYHLWANDCGKPGHPLDAESVSVLVRAEALTSQLDRWSATHWYAAAHENTLCDMSNGASAAALEAVHRGATVWISRDKHASFLDKKLCAQGCGKDDCVDSAALFVKKLVNLGEPEYPVNGTEWSRSNAWPLASKMKTDFSEVLLARMDAGRGTVVVPARDVATGMRTTIRIAGSTYWSLATANANTRASVTEAGRSTGSAVEKAAKTSVSAIGKSLRRSFGWLRPHPAKLE